MRVNCSAKGYREAVMRRIKQVLIKQHDWLRAHLKEADDFHYALFYRSDLEERTSDLRKFSKRDI